MANEAAIYDGELDEIQAIVTATNLVGGGAEESIKSAFQVAEATTRVRELITPEMMQSVMSMQGTILGFKTDKDRKQDGSKGPGYPMDVVKECFLAMAFYGLQPVNNQWNIIAGNPYIAKNGMRKMMDDMPGLSEFAPVYGVPKVGNGSVTTECKATWVYNGEKQGIGYDDPCIIPVNPNNGTAVDAVLGKVERKFRKRVIEQISGCTSIPDGEAEVVREVRATVTETTAQDQIEAAKADPRKLILDMFANDCDGKKEAQLAIFEKFTGKTTMRGYSDFAGLLGRIGVDGTERQEYVDMLGVLGLEAK